MAASVCQLYSRVFSDAAGGHRVGPPHEPHVHCAHAKDLLPPFELNCVEVMFLDIQFPYPMVMIANLVVKFMTWQFLDGVAVAPATEAAESGKGIILEIGSIVLFCV